MRSLFVPLSLFVALMATTSCEDNDDPVWGNAKNSHRIVQAIDYEDDVPYNKDVFSYQGDKLVSITMYDYDEVAGFLESERRVISYMGDHIIVNYESVENQGSFAWEERSRYIVRNGLMMEEINEDLIDGYWVVDSRWNYEYSGLNLTAWQEYSYNTEGAFKLIAEGEYEYSGNRLVGGVNTYYNNLGEVSYVENLLFEYTGNLLSRYSETYQIGEEQYSYRATYSYALNRVESRTSEFWNDTEELWEQGNVTNYEYDNYDNLTYRGDAIAEHEYAYEPGNGNARFFYIYPESMVYGGPFIKSAIASGEYIPYYKRLLTQIAQ